MAAESGGDTPGLRRLAEYLGSDRGGAVLDLSLGTARRIELWEGLAGRVRFAGLLPDPPVEGWGEAMGALLPDESSGYDAVVLWDVLGRVSGAERTELVERLAALTEDGALLYASVGPPVEGQAELLPAQVERLLEPFDVLHAFSLRNGVREYVARR